MRDLYTRYQFTDDGKVLDPPIIRRFESDLQDAAAANDAAQISVISEDYEKARREVAERHNDLVTEREEKDQALLAKIKEREENERRAAEEKEQAEVERREMERLRAEEGEAA